MNRMLLATISATCLSLAGCGVLDKNLQTASAGSVGAAPISLADVDAAIKALPQALQPSPKDNPGPYLAMVIADSIDKCTAFKRKLSFGERGFDTAGDVTSGLLSGLGGLFTPAGTARALSASAGIVTGIKSTVDADIYAKETAPLLIGAINSTYDKDISAQITSLNKTSKIDATNVLPTIDNIKTIHEECTLDRATTYLATQNQKNDQAPAPPKDQGGKPADATKPPASPPAHGGGHHAGHAHSGTHPMMEVIPLDAAPAPAEPPKTSGLELIRPTALPPLAAKPE